MPTRTDVAKRIKSPDGTKTAILIRRNSEFLRFAVKIKEGSKTRTLHTSRNFTPDLKADWNEKIIWSDDSNFIVFMADDVQNNNEKYMWAYDFKDSIEYNDKSAYVMELANKASATKTNNEIRYISLLILSSPSSKSDKLQGRKLNARNERCKVSLLSFAHSHSPAFP